MSQQNHLPSGAVNQSESVVVAAHATYRSRSLYFAAIVSLALTAFALRAVSLDAQSLWRDEVDAMRFATALLDEVLSNFTRPGWNGPFYVLALLAIYALRRAVDGDGWYWWGVQVFATSLAVYTHIVAALLIPVQVLIYFTWWPKSHRQWLGALISLACFTLPYLPLVGWQMSLLFQDGVDQVFQSPDQIVPTLLAGWRTGNPLLLRSRVTGFGHYTLGRMVHILLTNWSVGYFGFSGLARFEGAVLMAGLAGWGLLSFSLSLRGRGEALRKRLSLLCWLAVPGLIVWYISLRQPLFTDRYFIWSALAFYLLIAVGLAALWRLGGWRQGLVLLLVALVLAFNGVNQWLQATTPGKADFRGAVGYMAERYGASGAERGQVMPAPATCEGCSYDVHLPLVTSGSGEFSELIVFQIPYARYSFSYYFPNRDYAWAEGLYTNHVYPDGSYVMSEAQAAEEMGRMTEGYRVVWLVATEVEMWDERGLVKSWLDAHMRLTEKAEGEYLWVNVYRYER
jgi:mannosyltransferase